ncbi:hypothetical protein BRADI_2g34420v3 [Brachypodium distachyon]|uniref:Uncharacterized protein n=1 Tax=Brachypodium distachyon TaxID=15368 RepID=A0A2K2DBS5_BRADI|nr:hypothetical protein BRADI_2g34420v3 [Brachypodium distachyon]
MAQAGAGCSNDEEDAVELLSVNWNQDYSCFTAVTTNGFRIFRCKPFQEHLRRVEQNGLFGIVEALFRTNIYSFMGRGFDKNYPQNKVTIWDDNQNFRLAEFSYSSDIRAVKMSKGYFVVVLEDEVLVYSFMGLCLVHQAETAPNPKGLCCLSQHTGAQVMAFPGVSQGQVCVEYYGMKATNFYRCSFDPVNGGEMVLDEFFRFLKCSRSRSRTPTT